MHNQMNPEDILTHLFTKNNDSNLEQFLFSLGVSDLNKQAHRARSNQNTQNMEPPHHSQRRIKHCENYYNPFLTAKENKNIVLQNKEDCYIAHMNFAGATRDKISIQIEDNQLHITGPSFTSIFDNSQEQNSYNLILMPDIDISQISAKFENGILSLVAPKMKQQKNVKEIKIT